MYWLKITAVPFCALLPALSLAQEPEAPRREENPSGVKLLLLSDDQLFAGDGHVHKPDAGKQGGGLNEARPDREAAVSAPAGEPIFISFRMKNHGPERASINVGPRLSDLVLTVTGPAGRETPLTAYGKKEQLASKEPGTSKGLKLVPGEVFHQARVPITRYYDMTLEGTYQVTAARGVGVWTTDSDIPSFVTVRSEPFTIVVIPPGTKPLRHPPLRLSEKEADLIRRLRNEAKDDLGDLEE